MRNRLFFLFILIGLTPLWSEEFVQTNLRLSTFPSHALVFHTQNPSPGDYSAGETPLQYPTEDSLVLLTLKKPGFADTSFQLRINHEFPVNHFSVLLKPLLDSAGDVQHQEWFQKRKMHSRGTLLQYSSAVPLLAAAAGYALSYYYQRQALDTRDRLNASALRNSSEWHKALDSFENQKDKRDRSLSTAHMLAGTGGLLWSLGFYLRF